MPIRNINDLSPIETRLKPPPGGDPPGPPGGDPPDDDEDQKGKGPSDDENEDDDENQDDDDDGGDPPSPPSKKKPSKPSKKDDGGDSGGDDEYKDEDEDDDSLGPGATDEDDNDLDQEDEIEDRIEDLLSQREESTGKEKEPAKPLGPPKDINVSKGEKMQKIELPDPIYDWKTILAQFAKSKAAPEELSYRKPNPRSATQAHVGAQTGIAPLKPGIIKGDPFQFNLLMVFDTSYSMIGVIKDALSEARNLLMKYKKDIQPVVGVVFYSDKAVLKAGNLSTKEFWNISNLTDLGKPKPLGAAVQTQDEVLSQAVYGGTIFSEGLASQIGAAATKNYNTIIFSDDDILTGSNFTNFESLYQAHRSKIFFIASDISTYRNVLIKLKSRPEDVRKFGCIDKSKPK